MQGVNNESNFTLPKWPRMLANLIKSFLGHNRLGAIQPIAFQNQRRGIKQSLQNADWIWYAACRSEKSRQNRKPTGLDSCSHQSANKKAVAARPHADLQPRIDPPFGSLNTMDFNTYKYTTIPNEGRDKKGLIQSRNLLLSLLTCLVLGFITERAMADLDTRIMYSVEWLVDESDSIVIVRDSQNPGQDHPTVIKCIKGKEDSIVWPLTPLLTRWPDYKNCIPPSTGPVRLLYIRKSSLLLQSVSLGRKKTIPPIGWNEFLTQHDPIPIAGIHSTLYGVTQYGELLLTESSLYAAIENRMKMTRTPIKVRTHSYAINEHNSLEADLQKSDKSAYSSTPYQFPLNHTAEIYSIIVPSDTHRRDYYINVLQSGIVFDKISAVNELAAMMDPLAHAAVRETTQSNEIGLRYGEESSTREIGPWNSLRLAATTALKAIDLQRDLFLEQLKRPLATDKIEAIKNLVFFDDPKAIEAIRETTRIESATPYINLDNGTSIDVETVRETALQALKQLERDRPNAKKSP